MTSRQLRASEPQTRLRLLEVPGHSSSSLLPSWSSGWVEFIFPLKYEHDKIFDPYPYILFNLCLSMLAASQAPIILMSQNRQAEKDRLNADHDYQVNLKAELEIMLLHEKMDVLRESQWGELVAIQKEQLRLLEDLIEGGSWLNEACGYCAVDRDTPSTAHR